MASAKEKAVNMTTVYETNYRKLENLGIIQDGVIAIHEYAKLKSGAYVDLSIDRLSSNKLAMAHNYIQNGDVVPDPDMTLKVYPESKMVEVLSYQDSMGYREVYPEEGKVNLRAKQELNAFLGIWLSNLSRQGFNFYGEKNKEIENPKIYGTPKKQGWHKQPVKHALAAQKGHVRRRGF